MAPDQALPQNPASPPYAGATPYEGGARLIVKQPQQEEQHQITAGKAGGSTDTCCCIICIATAGLSLPFWCCWCLIK